ncbi:phosphatase PAP2 family protein [Corynebacterium mendelii]|uniref:Phosphatase PAP2 family protein n=1 Tax=Corynebacterium mendelii TaxID=2765362 RepID=A0A939E2H8_9CORY|nr:phosphatase PAP2 family protein [Corynebacterium mendelii]MBN9645270.1 phosphatase PAP2 family protein [Corynebacterium mendelii]
MSKRPAHSKDDKTDTDNTPGYQSFETCPDFDAADTAAGHTAGDPFGESEILVRLQDRLYDVPGAVPAARAMSLFGEHALGWIGACVIGAAIDNNRKQCWMGSAGLVFGAHAASVVVKRVVRRLRPHDQRIRIGVTTPSKLSFPSSHSTSTTTALICISVLTGKKSVLAGIPAMMVSRMLLGVHYPSDVAAGAALGAAAAGVAKGMICPAD